jgi:uncharacterized protein (DUF1330 family)
MMRIELLIGLELNDAELYAEYRRQMTPLLLQHQGDFGYDFVVQHTLKPSNSAINRVFTIHFASEHWMESFFNHPEYLQIKARCFEKSVTNTHILARYQIA